MGSDVKASKRFAGAVLVAWAAVLLGACSDRPAETAKDLELGAAPGLTVNGAGATFPAPLYVRWIQDFSKTRPDLHFNYKAVGSGEGIKRFLAGTVDFGASDAAMSDADLKKIDPSRGAEMIPMTAGMIVLAYNIPGVSRGLTLPGDVYVDIFAGKIRSWNDPRILAANRGLNLPNKPVQLVVRRDSSGTTFAFTSHLAAVNPSWKDQGPGVGKLVGWPSGAMTVPGNEGVAQRVKITDGSIGYMGYEFAKHLGLPMATLQNKTGQPIAPSPEAGQAALGSVTQIPADLRVYIPDPDGVASYPIVTYTWLLLNEQYQDPEKAKALKDALSWGLDQGQATAVEMGYIPLPESMVVKAHEALNRVH
jgi:phosphate transport system substrate-binding protein